MWVREIHTVGDRDPPAPAPRRAAPSPGQGEHRAVVVGVGVEVEQAGPAGGRERVEHGAVAPLRHVRHALEHRCRVRRGPGSTPVECRRCASEWHCRSTTTRSPGESPLRWSSVVEHAQAAERAGFDSLWLSDHLFLDVAKYGGPPDRHGVLDPIVALSALAGVVTRAAARHARAVRGVAPRGGAGQVAGHARPSVAGASTSASAPGGTNRSTRRIGMTMPSPGDRLGAPARGDRGAARPARRRTVHRRRHVPPRLRLRATTPPRCSNRRRRSSWAGRAIACSRSWRSWPTAGTPAGSGRRTTIGPARRARTRVRGGRARSGVGAAVARPLRALRRGRARPRAPVRSACRQTTPPGVLDGVTLDDWRARSPGRHRRPGAGAGGGLGRARGRDPDRRARGRSRSR